MCGNTFMNPCMSYGVTCAIFLKPYRKRFKIVMNVLKIAKHYSYFCVLLKTTTRGHPSSNLYASKYLLLSTSREDVCRLWSDSPLPHWGMFVLRYSIFITCSFFCFGLCRLLINGFRQLNNWTIFLVNGFFSQCDLFLEFSNKAGDLLCVSPGILWRGGR